MAKEDCAEMPTGNLNHSKNANDCFSRLYNLRTHLVVTGYTVLSIQLLMKGGTQERNYQDVRGGIGDSGSVEGTMDGICRGGDMGLESVG